MTRHHEHSPTPEEMRAQIEETREELGQTVAALAARVDVKAQARDKAELARRRFGEQSAHARAQVGEKTAHLARTVQEKAPEPALRVARDTSPVLLAAGAAGGTGLAIWLLRHRRR